ncbi:TadE family protein [Neobacillus bataviensis LMG 21833]|uniref:TadE family protein n=1 Tax=Neobacillus bataviensis LMG 21833 TaxID=1117379 RepID=K6D3D9_9BACI|nr:TadE family protein [Neobacillus bataviensis]EKN62548.1 TadE family protein [Neobacillus bataviensis LMG 21833]
MKSEKGQSLVEFALVLPLIIVLLFAIVDFGRAFHVYLTLDHTGREVARLISVGGKEADIVNVITSTKTSIDTDESQLTVTYPKTKLSSGSEAKVTLTYPFKFITPLAGIVDAFFHTKISEPLITDTTVMRVE